MSRCQFRQPGSGFDTPLAVASGTAEYHRSLARRQTQEEEIIGVAGEGAEILEQDGNRNMVLTAMRHHLADEAGRFFTALLRYACITRYPWAAVWGAVPRRSQAALS